MQPPTELSGSIEKAVEVLLHLHRAGEPCGVSAVGRALGLPKSSAHRLLAALARRALVERDGRGRYRPGFALVALGLGVLERDPLVSIARPALERAAAELGETFFLVSVRGGRLVVLDKAEGSGFLRAAPQVGAAVPAHRTAVGKLYRAFDPARLAPLHLPEGADAVGDLVPGAPHPHLERVRRLGYATNRDEWIPGLSVVAAPLHRLDGGGLLGAVALGAATPRLDAIGETDAARRVLDAASRVSARLAARREPGWDEEEVRA